MAVWKQSVDIKRHLNQCVDNDHPTDEEMRKLVDGIKTELRRIRLQPGVMSDQFDSIMDEFDMVGTDVEQFNDTLDLLYDWANDYRIWLGI